MNGVNHDFLWPFLVALLAGLIIYLVQFYRQGAAIRQALVGEINLLLSQCRDYHGYLSQDSHEWIKPGATLSGSPYFSRSSYRVYSALLPNLHLLSADEILQVISFYNHYESCESLIEILFGRIRQQEQSTKPLTQEQVDLTKLRVKRITDAINDALSSTYGNIDMLEGLPTAYLLRSSQVVIPSKPSSEEAK